MIGIVAEGPPDVAVIRNILKGKLGIDRDLTYAIRPELARDFRDPRRLKECAARNRSLLLFVDSLVS